MSVEFLFFWKIIVFLGVFTQVIGLISFLLFYFLKRPSKSFSELPGVTIAKPCHGLSDQEELNFETFFAQNYAGPLEIIFVVSEESDSCVPVIERLLNKYPLVDAKILVSTTRKAYWQKIDAYYDAFQVAKYDHFIISDSDVVVRPDYAEEMVAALHEPHVSFVTVPQFDFGIDNTPTAIKTLGNNCDVGIYVSLMNLFVRMKKVAFGHSIGFRRSEFNSFGEEAWEKIRNYFGDDLVLPSLFTDHGKKVVYRNIYCPVRFSNKSFNQVINQQERFAICQKAALGKWCAFGFLLFPQVTSFIFMLFTGFSEESLILFVIVWGLRLVVSLVVESLINKNIRTTLKYFWAIPIWDLLKPYFVFYAFTKNRMSYHGNVFRITSQFRVEKL